MSTFEQERDEVPEEWLDAWTGQTAEQRFHAELFKNVMRKYGKAFEGSAA